jgi:hypothetical protein
MKLGVDGVYDVGNKSSLFVGIDYQWADMRTVRLNNLSDPRDMSGPGLGAGFRVKL